MRIFLPGKKNYFSTREVITRSPDTEQKSHYNLDGMRPAIRLFAGILIIILIWQVLSFTVNRSIIPSPKEALYIFEKESFFIEIIIDGWQTLWKVMLAIVIAIIVGIPLGLCLGLSDLFYEVFRPLIMLIQAVPVISWLSLVVFTWGIGWRGPVFMAAVALLPVSILTTVSGVRNLDKNLLEMARVYRVSNIKVIKSIYLGGLAPFIIAILDVCIGQAWKVILVTEYLCGGKGLGVEILMARMNIDFPRVWAVTISAVSLGIIMERSVKFALGKISQRWMLA